MPLPFWIQEVFRVHATLCCYIKIITSLKKIQNVVYTKDVCWCSSSQIVNNCRYTGTKILSNVCTKVIHMWIFNSLSTLTFLHHAFDNYWLNTSISKSGPFTKLTKLSNVNVGFAKQSTTYLVLFPIWEFLSL